MVVMRLPSIDIEDQPRRVGKARPASCLAGPPARRTLISVSPNWLWRRIRFLQMCRCVAENLAVPCDGGVNDHIGELGEQVITNKASHFLGDLLSLSA